MSKSAYPVIISELNDDGHYYVATSPNIPGMVTQDDTFSDVKFWAKDVIVLCLRVKRRIQAFRIQTIGI